MKVKIIIRLSNVIFFNVGISLRWHSHVDKLVDSSIRHGYNSISYKYDQISNLLGESLKMCKESRFNIFLNSSLHVICGGFKSTKQTTTHKNLVFYMNKEFTLNLTFVHVDMMYSIHDCSVEFTHTLTKYKHNIMNI